MAASVEAGTRKRVLRVIVISLLLDLVSSCSVACGYAIENRDKALTAVLQISFTFILPLFPKLLEFYRDREAPTSGLATGSPTLLQTTLSYLNKYKMSFSKPIDSRYDIVLLGGALGSLFS